MARRTVADGRYELEKLPVAKGGMGEVYLGRDVKLDREIAVKFIRFPDGTPDEELVRRFVRESRITARLEHPGVPAVYDVGTESGRPYLVMQRIRGISVDDLIAEQGPLPVGWAAAIAAQVCAVLAVAHNSSLVHRDLKPANLMLEPDGTVKVLDFGLAVALDLTDASRITSTGQVMGTPAYMAPEQVMAGMSAPASDLYALGCTLHEMLTGRQVFRGSTAFAVMTKQVDEPPPPPRQLRRDLPAELDRAILGLLEKKPENRPANAGAVYRLLLPFVAELVPLPGVLNPPTLPSPVRMYSGVVSRVFAGAPRDDKASAPAPASEPERARPFDRGDLRRARGEAGSLMKQARYSQAADVLAAAAEPATRALGSTDDDVVGVRLELANVRFEGGDYRNAAPAYRKLAADLAERDGPESELVFRCRLQEATCHALTGATTVALRQLHGLLADERRVFGGDDARVLDLRRQIGLLQLGGGHRGEAEATLRALLDDLTRLHGPDHATTAKVRNLLTSASRHPT